MRLARVETPALIVDSVRLDANIRRMQERMRALGVTLRPHVKTAKCVDIAERIGGRDMPITVSTLREAEYFFAAGYRDILYAVSIVPAKLGRAAALVDRGCALTLILDDAGVADAVAAAGRARGGAFRVLIEIDSDDHRAGLAPGDAAVVDLARRIHGQAGIDFAGFLTHAGESYACDSTAALTAHAALERDAVLACARAVEAQGIDVEVRSVGSTPTATFAEDLDGITEVRAGVFVFQDLFQAGLGVCRVEDIALSVLTTVLSHKPSRNQLIVDAGGLALSKDRSTATQREDLGYGMVCDAERCTPIAGLVVGGTNQEHGLIDADEPLDYARFPIGSQLRILPNHACMTAAAYDRYHVVAGDEVVTAEWSRCNGW